MLLILIKEVSANLFNSSLFSSNTLFSLLLLNRILEPVLGGTLYTVLLQNSNTFVLYRYYNQSYFFLLFFDYDESNCLGLGT